MTGIRTTRGDVRRYVAGQGLPNRKRTRRMRALLLRQILEAQRANATAATSTRPQSLPWYRRWWQTLTAPVRRWQLRRQVVAGVRHA
jgi:hypothetical protein